MIFLILYKIKIKMTKRCQKCQLKFPTFGLSLGCPTHCKGCKSPEMFDVKNARCNEPGCKSQVSYGLLGFPPTKCSKHKDKEMINHRGNRCSEPGCKKTHCFYNSLTKEHYCYFHSDKTMLCINKPLYKRQSKIVIYF